MSSEKEVKELFEKFKKAGCEADACFFNSDIRIKAANYNGIGPEWLGECLRDMVTDHFELFAPAALEHDFTFCFTVDKTREEFDAENLRFYNNCLKLIKHEKSLGNLSYFSFDIEKSYWRRLLQARFLFRMCDLWGWDAFVAAKPVEITMIEVAS